MLYAVLNVVYLALILRHPSFALCDVGVNEIVHEFNRRSSNDFQLWILGYSDG